MNLVDVNICHTSFGLVREHDEDAALERPRERIIPKVKSKPRCPLSGVKRTLWWNPLDVCL